MSDSQSRSNAARRFSCWRRTAAFFRAAPLRAALGCSAGLAIGFAGGLITALQLQKPMSPPRTSVPHGRDHAVTFAPLPRLRPADQSETLPAVDVIDVDRVRSLARRRARVRGKIYRVGHSAKSNTHFLDFGPSHDSFTAVIFASAADAFERAHVKIRRYEGKEVEIVGVIEDDPRYGLEMIVEHPEQIRELE